MMQIRTSPEGSAEPQDGRNLTLWMTLWAALLSFDCHVREKETILFELLYLGVSSFRVA